MFYLLYFRYNSEVKCLIFFNCIAQKMLTNFFIPTVHVNKTPGLCLVISGHVAYAALCEAVLYKLVKINKKFCFQ
jgi:hypothetical protein